MEKEVTEVLEGHVLQITINRESKMNALNKNLIVALGEIFQRVAQNSDVRGIILTGEGEKAFVAGADIAELSTLTKEEAYLLARKGQQIFAAIEGFPKPVIALVNGFALGGGCELAMACHMRIATENAKFGQPEINLGIIPGYGGTQRLTQLVGRGKAIELLLTADMVAADEAKALGLVNHVVATKEEGLVLAKKMLDKVVSKSPIAVMKMIESVSAGFESEEKGYETEAQNFGACAATEDFKEGTTAFLQKRKAEFKGR